MQRGIRGYVVLLVALSLVLSGCASSRDRVMARIFEAPNVIHVCVRPPNVPNDKRMWALDTNGSPVFEAREVDLARRAGLGVYIFDEKAPRESARILPIPYHRLECPAPPKPRVAAAKVEVDVEKEEESKKAETKKAERPKPLPEAKHCGSYREPGQTRRRSGSGAPGCTRVLVHRGRTEQVVADKQPPVPREVEPPAPADPSQVPPGEVWVYEDWRQTPEEMARLDRAYECLQGVCHTRHKNFQKDKNKPAGTHNGQSLSTGSGSPKPAPKTTVKTNTRTLGKPNGAKPNGARPNGAAAGQASPANTGAAANERRVPNPNGRKGGKAHQDKVREIVEDIDKRGLTPKTEYRVKTPGGHKENRYVDVAGLDKKTQQPVEYHQVGKQTKGGREVARERRAGDDVEGAAGQRPNYHSIDK